MKDFDVNLLFQNWICSDEILNKKQKGKSKKENVNCESKTVTVIKTNMSMISTYNIYFQKRVESRI